MDRLEFRPGVNVIIGEPNAGKTSWLELLDYLFGDPGTPEDALGIDIAERYVSAKALLTIDDQPLVIERRWKERGGRGKVFVDGRPIDAADFSSAFLTQLGMPVVRIPKGSPYADHTWPELSWRTLLRHVYRKEWGWHDFAERQLEGDQRAVVLAFLGAADAVFSDDYGSLVDAQKRLSRLEAQKTTYEQTVHEVARELVTTARIDAGLTRDSLSAAIADLESKRAVLETERTRTLQRIRQEAQSHAEAQRTIESGTVNELGRKLEAARSRCVDLQRDVRRGAERVGDLQERLESVRDELAKLDRAKIAGDILVPLRVTHCPACDRPVRPHTPDGACFVCRQPLADQAEDTRATSDRVDFERNQLKEEESELADMVARACADGDRLRLALRETQDEMTRLEQLLEPVQMAAAWVIPPELTIADQDTGRLQERILQLERLRGTLDHRDELARDADILRADVARLEGEVENAKAAFEFTERGDQLADAMRDYLNQLDARDRARWDGRQVAVAVSESTVRFLVNGLPWKRSLGAHLRAYLFLAYQYALLKLSRTPPFKYPGLAVIDFPINLAAEFGISDQENYLLRPFVSLLDSPELKGVQLVAAGRAFAGLEGAHHIPLPPRRL